MEKQNPARTELQQSNESMNPYLTDESQQLQDVAIYMLIKKN
jgi:hypothetical protein